MSETRHPPIAATQRQALKFFSLAYALESLAEYGAHITSVDPVAFSAALHVISKQLQFEAYYYRNHRIEEIKAEDPELGDYFDYMIRYYSALNMKQYDLLDSWEPVIAAERDLKVRHEILSDRIDDEIEADSTTLSSRVVLLGHEASLIGEFAAISHARALHDKSYGHADGLLMRHYQLNHLWDLLEDTMPQIGALLHELEARYLAPYQEEVFLPANDISKKLLESIHTLFDRHTYEELAEFAEWNGLSISQPNTERTVG